MTDAFETWLGTLSKLGYDRSWIGHNLLALRTRYERTGGAPMPQCPVPTVRARDRYEEL